jgi:hypothetical protein
MTYKAIYGVAKLGFPKIDLQNLEWTFSMLNLYINDQISQLVPWILVLLLALKTEKYSSRSRGF